MILTLGDKDIIVFTDGSSRGNPGRGGFGAVTIYNDEHGGVKVDELGGREDDTTNNRMELKAVIEAIKNFEHYYERLSDYRFIIHTDSAYVLNGATKWLRNWQKNNWISSTKEAVKNQDLWEEFIRLTEQSNEKDLGQDVGKNDGRHEKKLTIQWHLLEGHAGVAGNERCDVIATSYADNDPTPLYAGSLASYEVKDILNIATDADALQKKSAKKSSQSKKSGPAYSYVSAIDGKVMTHKTWAECEARVRGKRGARFKKAFSQSEEQDLIKAFSS